MVVGGKFVFVVTSKATPTTYLHVRLTARNSSLDKPKVKSGELTQPLVQGRQLPVLPTKQGRLPKGVISSNSCEEVS